MSTVTLPWQADRRVTLVWITTIWTFALFGFGADFARFLHEHPSPPLILDLHGTFSVPWLGLVSTQVLLAETGNIPLHRGLGWVTVSVSAAMVTIGVVIPAWKTAMAALVQAWGWAG